MKARERREVSILERLHSDLIGAVLAADRLGMRATADVLEAIRRRVLARRFTFNHRPCASS